MYTLLNIPKHKGCQNCGQCCGPVPASKREIENIRKHIANNPEVLNRVGIPNSLTCIFRSEKEKKCLIYPVRPLVCRLMGVAEGLVCEHGNSTNIDGTKFMNQVFIEKPQILNMVRWMNEV